MLGNSLSTRRDGSVDGRCWEAVGHQSVTHSPREEIDCSGNQHYGLWSYEMIMCAQRWGWQHWCSRLREEHGKTLHLSVSGQMMSKPSIAIQRKEMSAQEMHAIELERDDIVWTSVHLDIARMLFLDFFRIQSQLFQANSYQHRTSLGHYPTETRMNWPCAFDDTFDE